MEFIKYQHLERWGTYNTEGIDIGTCYIFPKIDGANVQIWYSNGEIHTGSRNMEITEGSIRVDFHKWVQEQDNIEEFFIKNPTLRLHGEWLVPHTLKTYSESAWNNFYVFDVIAGETYLTYECYKDLLDVFDIKYIVAICKIKNPSEKQLINQLEKNTYLIQDGKGTGEGIVIKNYHYKNNNDNIRWAKIVKNEFKDKHIRESEICKIAGSKQIERDIVNKYITISLIEKEKAKIDNDCEWSSKQIPRLLNTIYYCLITEESWNFIKEFKKPVIDFKKLLLFSTAKIKELKPELFNVSHLT